MNPVLTNEQAALSEQEMREMLRRAHSLKLNQGVDIYQGVLYIEGRDVVIIGTNKDDVLSVLKSQK